jgi:hypothetical protein
MKKIMELIIINYLKEQIFIPKITRPYMNAKNGPMHNIGKNNLP